MTNDKVQELQTRCDTLSDALAKVILSGLTDLKLESESGAFKHSMEYRISGHYSLPNDVAVRLKDSQHAEELVIKVLSERVARQLIRLLSDQRPPSLKDR